MLNNGTVTKYNVSGTGVARSWVAKTALEIIADFNGVLTGIYTGTRQVEMADTVLLPVDSYSDISSMPYRDMTVLMFLKKFNVYTARTGQPLNIMTYRGLEAQGAGATRGRMIAYRRAMDVLKFHMPMPTGSCLFSRRAACGGWWTGS